MKKITKEYLTKYLVDNSFIINLLCLFGIYLITYFIVSFIYPVLDPIIQWVDAVQGSADFHTWILVFGIIGILVVLSILGGILMILIEKIGGKIFQKKSSRILNYTKYVRRLEKLCKSRILEINEILEIAKQAYILLYKFIELGDKQKGLRYEDTNITLFVKDQSLKIVRILTDLRSDLTLRLAEQQKTLEGAKSDVEMNIVGTPELNEVSELQKARLDRQIEQFEELQKVLVEV